MATAIVTFTTDENEPDTLAINVEFDPDFKNTDGEKNPLCHAAAMISLEAVADALALGPVETEGT